MDDGEVVIETYYDRWPKLFTAVASDLRMVLGAVALRIDHVGSTSVPGLEAKPVIDVQVSVDALDPIGPFVEPLVTLGYRYRADNPIRTSRFFREPEGGRRVHLRVHEAGTFSEQLNLLFRDYLRAHPTDADDYARLKRALADVHRSDRAAYTRAKHPFIWEALARANEWSNETGWRPPPGDA